MYIKAQKIELKITLAKSLTFKINYCAHFCRRSTQKLFVNQLKFNFSAENYCKLRYAYCNAKKVSLEAFIALASVTVALQFKNVVVIYSYVSSIK